MSDGPIYTGQVQLQLSGDLELARTYTREGRRLLGGLLAVHGVGEDGGFFKSVRELDDGTRITALTNNGQHLVRIDTPPKRATPPVEGEHHSAASPVLAGRYHVEGGNDSPVVNPPPPPTLYRETGEEGEEEKKDSTEYMWVGIRSTNANVPWYAVSAVMVEPDTGPAWGDDGYRLRGVIESIAEWQGALQLIEGGDGTFTLGHDFPLTFADDIASAVQQNYDDWHAAGGAQDNIIPGTHAISVTMYPSAEGSDEAEIVCSANGLRCFMTVGTSQATSDPARWLPFDPLADDQTGAGVRDYGDRHIPDSRAIAPRLWDIAYVCDPDEGSQEYPCETRPHVLRAREALEKAGMRNTMLSGEYLLGVHIYDDAPQLRSNRAGEVIPLYAGDDFGYRSDTSDYDEFMKPIDTTLNTQVEIEVRLKRGADAVTLKFATVVASADDRGYAYLPYGLDHWDECFPQGGPNPLGPNWAPQWLAIDAMGGAARWADPAELDLLPIFGGGQYGNPGDHRRPLDIYFTIYGPSQPDQADFAEYMANALFAVMEAASAGVYGEMKMKDPISEANLQGFLAGVSKSQLWRFDPMSMSLAAVPLVSAVGDYPYGMQDDGAGGTFMSPYIEPMFWYYPYKIQSRDQCRNSLGICITAVKGTYFFENGQSVYYEDPPVTVECC